MYYNTEAYTRALEVRDMHPGALFEVRRLKKKNQHVAVFRSKPGHKPFIYKAKHEDAERAIELATQQFRPLAKRVFDALPKPEPEEEVTEIEETEDVAV